jgi:uncharacterized protein (DUF302 family)
MQEPGFFGVHSPTQWAPEIGFSNGSSLGFTTTTGANMYGFTVTLNGNFDDVVTKVTEALKGEGFGVLTEIDVKATLKAKLGVDKLPYKILGACNPQLASQAIDAEPDIGLLLPCNVIVREAEDGTIIVGFMDPAAVLGLVGREELKILGAEVRSRLERVRDALAA